MCRKIKIVLLASAIVVLAIACKKNVGVNNPNPGGGNNNDDTTGPLKAVASFPIGMAIDYTLFKNNSNYRTTVARESDGVTFGYQMKHGAIVRDDGSFDFSRADELLNLANAAGLEVFGH